MADRFVYVKEGRWFGERKVQAEGRMGWGGLPTAAEAGMLAQTTRGAWGEGRHSGTRDVLCESFFTA